MTILKTGIQYFQKHVLPATQKITVLFDSNFYSLAPDSQKFCYAVLL